MSHDAETVVSKAPSAGHGFGRNLTEKEKRAYLSAAASIAIRLLVAISAEQHTRAAYVAGEPDVSPERVADTVAQLRQYVRAMSNPPHGILVDVVAGDLAPTAFPHYADTCDVFAAAFAAHAESIIGDDEARAVVECLAEDALRIAAALRANAAEATDRAAVRAAAAASSGSAPMTIQPESE